MFYQPHSIVEALAMKERLGPEATFLAGGTDLIVMLNHGRSSARSFIDLTHVPGLDYVSEEREQPVPATLRIGGGATFARLARLPINVLSESALGVGGPQIRNRATIAGNLATASPAGDGSTALLALDASITLRTSSATRSMPLRDFFLDYRKTALAPDEMIDSVTVPSNWSTAWVKLGKRGAMNISVVCCAVGISEAGQFHIAFGSVGPYPLLVPETARFLTQEAKQTEPGGRQALPEVIVKEASRMVAAEVRPIDDFRAKADYRRAMTGALLQKALRQITDISS